MNIEKKSTLFTEDSRANHSANPGKEKAKTMTAISGMKCYESFAKYVPNGALLKMFSDYLLCKTEWPSKKFVLIWKMRRTSYSRLLFRLVPLMHRTDATEFGSLLKTPTKAQFEGSKTGMKPGSTGTLSQQFRFGLLKTPTASECEGGIMEIRGNANAKYKLRDQIHSLKNTLPTPKSRDSKGKAHSHRIHTHKFSDLNDEISLINGTNTGFRLQPEFVEWMMGFPEGFTNVLCNNKPLTRAKRLEMLGNAVVSDVPFMIFQAIEFAELNSI